MFTRKALGAAALVVAMAGAASAQSTLGQPGTPNLGTPITPADIAAWDIAIGPNGEGLPAGSGTARQATQLYVDKCASCHGLDLMGKPADRLIGRQGQLATEGAVKTVGSYWPYAPTLFDFIRRSMPLNEPQTLTNDEVYQLSAYILFKNGIIGENAKMDAKSLPKVKMPNREGFVQIYPNNLP